MDLSSIAATLAPSDIALIESPKSPNSLSCLCSIITPGRYEFALFPDEGFTRALQSKALMMGSMLQDTSRNQAYRSALAHALASQPPDPVILDAGAGTGLLSVLAAQSHPASHVFALEMNPAIAHLCALTVEENNVSAQVTVIPQRTTDIELTAHPATIVVSETMDSLLLNEGLLPTMRDALSRLAVPDATAIPSKATCLGKLVEIAPGALHNLVASTGGLALPDLTPVFAEPCTKPVLCRVDAPTVGSVLTNLSPTLPLYSVDFSSSSPEGLHETTLSFPCFRKGTAHALLVSWTVELAPGICLTTNPEACPAFQNHWHQVLWPLPSLSVQAGEPAVLNLCRNDTTMRISIDAAAVAKKLKRAEQPVFPLADLVATREDEYRLGELAAWIRRAVPVAPTTKSVLDLSPAHLSPLLWPSCPTHYTLASDLAALITARFTEAGSNQIASFDDISSQQDELVLLALLPWENQLDACMALHLACKALPNLVQSFPSRALIKAQLVCFEQLTNPLCVPDVISDMVRHQRVNQEWRKAFGDNPPAFDILLSNYAWRPVSSTVELGSFDFQAKTHVLHEPQELSCSDDRADVNKLAIVCLVEYSASDHVLACEGVGWHSRVVFCPQRRAALHLEKDATSSKLLVAITPPK